MDVLLRDVREHSSGTTELHDTELTLDALSIGSAHDQGVQLLGREIAPRHAVIKVVSGGAVIECARSQRIRVNGEACRSATLQEGAVIEVAGHRLTVVRPPAGFDLALEIRRDANVAASEFERAFRTDLNQTWLAKRPAAWTLVALTLLLVGAAPLVGVMWRSEDATTSAPGWLPSDALWSSGPLTPAHQLAVGDRCDVCHQQLFQRVQDGACTQCHETTHEHVDAARMAKTSLGPVERCAACHREHKEPESFLVARDNRECTACHAQSAELFPALDSKPVSGFDAKRHPAFQAHLLTPVHDAASAASFEWAVQVTPLDGAVERSNLKFSHTQHLDEAKVLRTSDSQPLGCGDCHRLSADGEHFEQLTMQSTCASCHELTFDPAAPDRQLPHGKPREVLLTLQDYYTRKYSDPNPPRARFERRRVPGHEEREEECTGPAFACAMRSAANEAEAQFARRGCVSCHEVVDTQAEDLLERYRVSPVRLTADYFPTSSFNHRAHRVQGKLTGDAACQSCHAAQDSQQSANLLIPGLENCAECHSDAPRGFAATRPATLQIELQCVNCHAYHPSAAAPSAANLTHE